MNLRHDDEPLSPEEARAFLQVHAEREAHASKGLPDGPRLADLAASLRLPLDEARSILDEARSRVRPRPRGIDRTVLLGALLGIAMVIIVIVGVAWPSPKPSLAATGARTPVALQQIAVQAPSAITAGTEPVLVPDGFEIAIRVPDARVGASGSPLTPGTNPRGWSDSEAGAVRERLVEASLAMVNNALENSGPWMRAQELSVDLRVAGGGWTLVKVPLRPFTLPLEGNPQGREELRRTLRVLYEAGWGDVLRATPQ